MASEPEVVWMPDEVRTEIRLGGDDTGGAFCLLLDEPPAGWSLPAHIHTDAAEVRAASPANEVDHRAALAAATRHGRRRAKRPRGRVRTSRRYPTITANAPA